LTVFAAQHLDTGCFFWDIVQSVRLLSEGGLDVQQPKRQRPVGASLDDATAASGDYGYRKTVSIAGLEGHVRESPRSPVGRFGLIIGAGVTGRTALGNQLQCPVLQMDTSGISQFKVEEDEFVEEAIRQIPQLAQAKQVALVGISGGGYVALAFGMAFAKIMAPRPVRVIAFNPPTKIWPLESTRMNAPLYRGMMELAERDQRVKQALEKKGDLVPWLERFPREVPNGNFRALVIGSLNKERDAWHVERVSGLPGIATEMLDTDVHMLHRLMLLPISSREGTRDDLVRRWSRFDDPEGSKKALSEGEVTQIVDVMMGLRAKYPHLRAMIDALDTMPVASAPVAAAAAG
jgi:hypothetical protein